MVRSDTKDDALAVSRQNDNARHVGYRADVSAEWLQQATPYAPGVDPPTVQEALDVRAKDRLHVGSSAPALVEGRLWLDTGATSLGMMPPWVVTGTKTGAYTAALGEFVVCDPTAGGFTVTLPAVATAKFGRSIVVKNHSGSTNTITIAAAGSDKIDGAATVTITTARGVTRLVNNGIFDWMTW